MTLTRSPRPQTRTPFPRSHRGRCVRGAGKLVARRAGGSGRGWEGPALGGLRAGRLDARGEGAAGRGGGRRGAGSWAGAGDLPSPRWSARPTVLAGPLALPTCVLRGAAGRGPSGCRTELWSPSVPVTPLWAAVGWDRHLVSTRWGQAQVQAHESDSHGSRWEAAESPARRGKALWTRASSFRV